MVNLGMSYDEMLKCVQTILNDERYHQRFKKLCQKITNDGAVKENIELYAQLALTPEILAAVLEKNNEIISAQLEELLKNRN